MATIAPKTELKWKVKEKSRNVHVVNIDATGAKSEQWEQYFLLSGCRHFDNAHSDVKMQRKHLDQAKERGAGVIDIGDFHCAMQGKWDKRSNPVDARSEYQQGRYLDCLVDYAADFLAPYAENIVLLGRGNHETSILKKHETCLTQRTAERVRALTGTHVHVGGYGGWVRFCVNCPRADQPSR